MSETKVREKTGDGWRFSCDECAKVFDVFYDMNISRAERPKFCTPKCYATAQRKRAQERTQARFWKYVERRGPDECWPWIGYRRAAGYGWFKIPGGPTGNASRAAYILTHGDIPPGRILVCHSCDNPPCCNPAHLWLGTDADNSRDRDQKGRTKQGPPRRGPMSNKTKLSASIAIAIIESPEGNKTLARRYGVTASAVYNIRHGKAWAHVTGIDRHAP